LQATFEPRFIHGAEFSSTVLFMPMVSPHRALTPRVFDEIWKRDRALAKATKRHKRRRRIQFL
jgi:hypothetical protein